jgi:ATP synthase protein I
LTSRGTGNASDPVAEAVSSNPSSESGAPPQGEYERLQNWLQLTTLGLSLVATLCVAVIYSPAVAFSYALGAMGGIIYLRMLGRGVSQLGKGQFRLGWIRFLFFAGLIVLAARTQSLQILPVFLGFLSYKFTLLLHVLQILFRPSRPRS